jgi:hypothetical protein
MNGNDFLDAGGFIFWRNTSNGRYLNLDNPMFDPPLHLTLAGCGLDFNAPERGEKSLRCAEQTGKKVYPRILNEFI